MSKTFFCIMALSGVAMGAVPDAGDLQQSATRQEQIRGDGQQLGSRLDEIIAEYVRNGLAKGKDYEVLKSVRATLGSLSDDEMEKVVVLLNQAGTSETPAGEAEPKAKAYAGEKDISLRLKEILAAHERQQDIDSLAGAVRQLADRQAANLRTAMDVKQLAAQDTSANGQTAVATSEEAQQGEQGAIAGEVKLIADKLGKIASEAGEAAWKDAAAQLEGVQPQAAAASDALSGGRLDDAVAAESATRDKLDEVARALAPANKQESVANPEAGQLADIARQQRALLDRTKPLADTLKQATGGETPEETDKAMQAEMNRAGSPLAKQLAERGITPASPVDQIRNAPEMQKFLAARTESLKQEEQEVLPKLASLATEQAALAAKAQTAREDLDKTVKEAAVPMANALTEMNSAQNALAQGDAGQAAQNETEAASQLDQAGKLADQKGANVAQAQPVRGGGGPRLQQLQRQVNDLAAKETASLQQGDAQKTGPAAVAAATAQENMSRKAQSLEQMAASQGSPSAEPLLRAADALSNAAQAMQKGVTPAAAQAAQQTALQNLEAAGQQLGQNAATASQDKQQLANMEKQMQGLAKLIQEQRQTNLDTGKALEKERAWKGKSKELARREANLQKNTENARQALITGTPDAAKALDRADAAMGEAGQKLSEGNGEEAAHPQQAAVAALYQAQDALADQMQKLAQDMGEPKSSAQELANTEAALVKAQKEAAAAQEAMAPGQNGNGAMRSAMAQLDQAARSMAQVEGHPDVMSQEAREAVRNAQQALAEAATAAGGGNQQQAQTQAGQGQKAMQAAQSALGRMQSGVAELNPPSGQGGPGGQAPGQQGQGQPSQQSQSQSQSQQGSQSAMSTSATGANEQNWKDTAGAVTRGMQGAHGAGQFLGLPERDRGAVQQSQSERYPPEYGSMIEEYMRSLASDTGGK